MKVDKMVKTFLMSPSIIPDNLRYSILRSKVKVPELPEGVRFLAAQSREDLHEAYRLLHDAYVEKGIAIPHPSGIRTTVYHMEPSTRVLIAKQGKKMVATISVIRDGFWGLPADEIVDLSSFRRKGEDLAELSSLAIDPEFRGNSGQILFCLLKYLLLSTIKNSGIDRMVVCVNPVHASLYEALFGFTRFSRKAVNSYGFANGAPAICSTMKVKQLPEIFYRLYHKAPEERNFYRYCFEQFNDREKSHMVMGNPLEDNWGRPYMDRESFLFFFGRCTDILSGLTSVQMDRINRIYPPEASPAKAKEEIC